MYARTLLLYNRNVTFQFYPFYREASIIATMAWNTTRHMEAWYGIMGVGGVVHTLNPRQSDRVS